MRKILYYHSESEIPTKAELLACIDIANAENAEVVLKFFHNRPYQVDISPGQSFASVKNHLDGLLLIGKDLLEYENNKRN